MSSDIIYVDVDDTLVRSAGTKRMPIPMTIEAVRTFFVDGKELYCWSGGGAEYARDAAIEPGIEECFRDG